MRCLFVSGPFLFVRCMRRRLGAGFRCRGGAGIGERHTFSDILLGGLAKAGGLYLLAEYPRLSDDELARWCRRADRLPTWPRRSAAARATIVTGELFGPVMRATAGEVGERLDIELRAVPIVNDFLGPTVNVAGLLAGTDIVRQLAGTRVGDLLLVPGRALDQRGERFLDGTTVAEVARAVGAPVAAGREFADLLRTLGLR